MPMAQRVPTRIDYLHCRIVRRLDLLRGHIVRWRGATAGDRFGVGRGTIIVYPSFLTVGDDISISEYSYMHCLANEGVTIGSRSSIDRNLWLHCGGHPDDHGRGFFRMGSRSYIGANAIIGAGGGIAIGSDVLIGQSVNMHAESHNIEETDRCINQQGVSFQGIVIEDDVWIGSKVTILDGVTIGRGAVIGAGSVVVKSVRPFEVAVGVPARVVRSRLTPQGIEMSRSIALERR
jgi:acetyltransferase-like isoleucine patch superfamily enzyme